MTKIVLVREGEITKGDLPAPNDQEVEMRCKLTGMCTLYTTREEQSKGNESAYDERWRARRSPWNIKEQLQSRSRDERKRWNIKEKHVMRNYTESRDAYQNDKRKIRHVMEMCHVTI